MFVMNLLNKTGLAEDREMIGAGPAAGRGLMVSFGGRWNLSLMGDGPSATAHKPQARQGGRGRWSTNDINYCFVLIPM
jgi:hypothetical protein